MLVLLTTQFLLQVSYTLMFIFIYNLLDSDLSISEKAMILSDGFCNDLLVSVYSDIGIPMDKPYTYGFTTPSVSRFSLFIVF